MSMQNVHELLALQAKKNAGRPALRQKVRGQWQTWTWSDLARRTRTLGQGLVSLGIERGDRVAILGYSSREWVMADLSIISLGCVSVPVYQSNTPEECEYILNNSESRFLFVENRQQLDKIRKVRERLPHLQKVIVFDDTVAAPEDWVMTLDALFERGEKEDEAAWEALMKQVRKEDLLTLVYTSGTTGPPKGVMLTHANILFMASSVKDAVPITVEDETLLFLPLAHIFARMIEYAALERGFAIHFAESIDKVAENLPETRPTFVMSVPRIFEKIYAKIQSGFNEAGGFKLWLFNWSLKVGREVSMLRQKGQEPKGWLAFKFKWAGKLIFSKIKQKVFGGRVRFFGSGGAPLAKEIAEFFHAMDMLVLEGYGLTETSAATNINRMDRFRFGSVGNVLPGVEMRIAADGEVLLRGGNIMRGYYRNDEATREVIDDEHWFHSGDIGEIRDGFLYITDRKKDIIVTAGGKNIAPQNLEGLLKGEPLISQAMVIGDRRPCLVALLTANGEELEKWAKGKGISGSRAMLVEHPEVRRLYDEKVAAVNAKLASFEQVKRFKLLATDFAQETGELTPTLKVRRKFCSEKYKEEIEELYGGAKKAAAPQLEVEEIGG